MPALCMTLDATVVILFLCISHGELAAAQAEVKKLIKCPKPVAPTYDVKVKELMKAYDNSQPADRPFLCYFVTQNVNYEEIYCPAVLVEIEGKAHVVGTPECLRQQFKINNNGEAELFKYWPRMVLVRCNELDPIAKNAQIQVPSIKKQKDKLIPDETDFHKKGSSEKIGDGLNPLQFIVVPLTPIVTAITQNPRELGWSFLPLALEGPDAFQDPPVGASCRVVDLLDNEFSQTMIRNAQMTFPLLWERNQEVKVLPMNNCLKESASRLASRFLCFETMAVTPFPRRESKKRPNCWFHWSEQACAKSTKYSPHRIYLCPVASCTEPDTTKCRWTVAGLGQFQRDGYPGVFTVSIQRNWYTMYNISGLITGYRPGSINGTALVAQNAEPFESIAASAIAACLTNVTCEDCAANGSTRDTIAPYFCNILDPDDPSSFSNTVTAGMKLKMAKSGSGNTMHAVVFTMCVKNLVMSQTAQIPISKIDISEIYAIMVNMLCQSDKPQAPKVPPLQNILAAWLSVDESALAKGDRIYASSCQANENQPYLVPDGFVMRKCVNLSEGKSPSVACAADYVLQPFTMSRSVRNCINRDKACPKSIAKIFKDFSRFWLIKRIRKAAYDFGTSEGVQTNTFVIGMSVALVLGAYAAVLIAIPVLPFYIIFKAVMGLDHAAGGFTN